MVTGEDYTELEREVHTHTPTHTHPHPPHIHTHTPHTPHPLQHKRVVSSLESMKADYDAALQSSHELSVQLKAVCGEREELEGELATLKGRLNDAEHSAG